MSRKKRVRRRVALLTAALLLAAGALLVNLRLAPFVRQAARARVINVASDRITDAVNDQLQSGAIDYSRIIRLQTDSAGAVTALQTDMAEVNRLKAVTVALMCEDLAEMDTRELSLPLGSVLMPEFFAGQGPLLPVRVVSLTTTDADFFTEFTEAGINQTQQKIWLRLAVDIQLLTPVGQELVSVSSELLVAQTVLLGRVPETYIQIGNQKEWG